MVRHRKRKRQMHGQTTADLMKRAVELVQKGQTIREIAKALAISKSTLQRYVTKANSSGLENIRLTPNYSSSRIFTDMQEEELAEYLLTASKHHHGLTTNATKELAFQYAKKNEIKFPESWEARKQAGDDWFYGFMKRHRRLSIRNAKATSLGRATSFNKTNVEKFFQNLETVMEKYKFEPAAIYNCDETGLTTVHSVPKVIANKNAKQVGQVTSAERGTLVTVMCAINAQGNAIPPFMIFPRVHFKEHMLKNAPPGTSGTSNPSGWMNAANFETWMDHFIRHSHSSVEHPVLLLLDNHDSHVSIGVLDKAKSNGVVMLTFPPHCSHKLQPLDRTVYGPLKKFYSASCNAWMLNNPGKPMTIYEIAGMLGESYPRAFSPRNVIAGFRCTGTYPFDRNIFDDDEFLSSYVTDRPDTSVSADQQAEFPNSQIATTSSGEHQLVADEVMDSQDCTEPPISSHNGDIGLDAQNSPVRRDQVHFSPQDVRPFPKAAPRKGKGGRKKGKTLILTDTPVKNQLEAEAKEREERKAKKTNKRKPQAKKVPAEEDYSSETSEDVETSDIVDDSDELDSTVKRGDLNVGGFVLVKYSSKKVTKHYVGKILKELDDYDMLEIQFVVRQPSKTQQAIFYFPENDDIADVDLDDIVQKLPQPSLVGGTKRTLNQFVFDVDLSQYYRLC